MTTNETDGGPREDPNSSMLAPWEPAPASSGKGGCVMLAEDDTDLREALAAMLQSHGYDVIEVPDGADVCSWVEDTFCFDRPHRRIDALVCDVCMPGVDGLAALSFVRDIGWSVPTVLITAFGTPEVKRTARELGARALLEKPFRPEALLAILDQTLAA